MFFTAKKIFQKRFAEANWESELIHKAEAKKGNDSYKDVITFNKTLLTIYDIPAQILEMHMLNLHGYMDRRSDKVSVKSYTRGWDWGL